MGYRIWAYIVSAVLAVAGSLFLAGYLVGSHQLFPYPILKKIEQLVSDHIVNSPLWGDEGDIGQGQQISTIFLNLSSRGVELPAGREGAGGGLTSFGPYVILLTHDGRFYAARDASDVSLLNMQPPDNHFEDYQSAALKPPYNEYEHDFGWFRYNDIQYFRNGNTQGFLASYTSFNREEDCFNTSVSKLIIDPEIVDPTNIQATPESWEVLYETQPCLPLKKEFRAIEGHMAGGRMTYDGDGTIYLASGDYHWDGIYAPQALAQKTDNDYGKVISIDIECGQGTAITIGNRNMQGITFDQDGELWTVEHGIRGGDEINRVVAGENYGWPEETLGTLYSSLPVPNTRSYGRHETFRKPAFSWLPSIAISGLTTINGFHEAWDGDLLASSLKDKSLHRIRISEGRVLFDERIPIGERLRYVHSHDEDTIVVWTDHHRLIFLEVAPRGIVAEFVGNHIDRQNYSDEDKRRVRTAIDRCMECHSFDPTDSVGAPSLALVFNAQAGTTQYAGYSPALKGHGTRWTEDALKAYLQSPTDYIPGTVMPNPGIQDEFILNEIIGVLKAIRTTPQNVN
jgi:cytochrome c2